MSPAEAEQLCSAWRVTADSKAIKPALDILRCDWLNQVQQSSCLGPQSH